jgi:hypothetical protein
MTTEKIIADAEVAACYLRTLLANGVPMIAAIQVTSSYVSARLISERGESPPREPWQDP